MPKDLEEKFVKEIISEFVKEDNMQTLKSQYFSNQLHKALYGETWTTRAKRIKKEAKKEAKEEAREEARKKVEEAQKEAQKQAKEAQKQAKEAQEEAQKEVISKLLLSEKHSVEEISKIMEVDIKIVKAIQEKL